VIWVCADVPFQLAVMVASVLTATGFVGIAIAAVLLPAGTVAEAGGLTAGESLDRFRTAPPAGAWPVNTTFSWPVVEPVIVGEENEIDFNAVGATVSCVVALAPLRVAVTVTGVEIATCPACTCNCAQPMLGGMANVAGRANAEELELVSWTVAPLAPAATESCT
jgi:hypothetical protein